MPKLQLDVDVSPPAFLEVHRWEKMNFNISPNEHYYCKLHRYIVYLSMTFGQVRMTDRQKVMHMSNYIMLNTHRVSFPIPSRPAPLAGMPLYNLIKFFPTFKIQPYHGVL